MECTQAEAYEQYIRDLRVVRSISRPSFPEGKAPAAVLEEIQTNALRCNTLMRQNEALLAQFVYDRDPASLTEEDIQGLSAFAGRLFNYANSEDIGVAFKVPQLLLAAARRRETGAGRCVFHSRKTALPPLRSPRENAWPLTLSANILFRLF